MKKYFGTKFLGRQRKIFFFLVLLIVIFLLIGFLSKIKNSQLVTFNPLPTWEVQDPVSTVFVMNSIPSTTGSLAAGNSTVPNEYLVDPAIDTMLIMMQSQNIYLHKTAAQPSGIVGSDNIVIIKGNFQWTSRLTTSTDRIKGIIWQILQHPDGFIGEIIICDNTQDIGTGINQDDNNSEDPEQSIVDVVNTFSSKGYPVSLRDWNSVSDVVVEEYSAGDYNDGYIYESNSKISYPKFTSPSGNYNISLRYGIWDSNSLSYDLDRLCIIDFAVLKAHGMAGATIALKNWIGVLTTAYSEERYGGDYSMHYNYLFGQYALVAKVMGVTFPKLTIVDAAWTSASSNWQLTDTIQTKMLLGSTDPCAVSWYAAKYILTPIAVDPNHTDPDRDGSKYKNNLSAWTNFLRDSGFACTKDSSEICVYDRAVLSATSTYNLTVSIFDGWNMVAAPGINPAGMGVATWWPRRTGTVWGFNGTIYVSRTVATPGEGYWMKNTIAETYNYPAIQIVPHNPIPVTLGWNMIGGYEASPTVANLKLANSQITGTVWGFNGVQYVAAVNIVPGYSYWVKVTAAGTITIPDAIAKSGEVVDLFKEDLGRVILTDAAGRSFTLYAVKGEVDLDQYEMPPMPPEGMFDIRFSSGRVAEDLNSSIKTIDMSGIKYPLTVRVEGMDIRLQDMTGKQINVNLKSGEDIVISDATINKLMVSGELIPEKYSLEQNYPNPFNPSTWIKFHVPELNFVTLKIYDVLGNEIANLVNEEKSIGSFEIKFDATGLPSGIYFYRLRVGSFFKTKKMVLMK